MMMDPDATPEPTEPSKEALSISAGTRMFACPECGDFVEIKNVEAVLLSMHLQNACPATKPLVGYDE